MTIHSADAAGRGHSKHTMCNSESPNALSNNMLKILYYNYNARSLLPKFDELLILADSHKPDIICITES